MSVSIVCDKCEKRLTIPESVVGRSIKCPACGAVFKADPAKVQAAAGRPTAAKPDGEEGAPTTARTAEEEPRPPRTKAAEDEPLEVVPVKKSAVIIEDDDEPPQPRLRRGRRVDEYGDYDDDYEDEPRGKPVTAWYVMLPLVILSFSAAGLALMWPVGFSWMGLDQAGSSLSLDSRIWVGIGLAAHVVLLCLIFSLMPTRAWLRFVMVLLLLVLAYGESWAVLHWWKQLPFGHEERPVQPTVPLRPDRGQFPPPFGPDNGGPP